MRRRGYLRKKARGPKVAGTSTFTPDLAPETVAPFDGAHPPRVRLLVYGPEFVEVREGDALGDIELEAPPGAVRWFDIEGVGDAEIFTSLGELLGLHPLALEDMVNLGQRPKAEDYGEHTFVALRSPASHHGTETGQLSLVVGDDYVVTVQEGEGDALESIRDRIRSGRGRIRANGADYLAYAAIDAVVDRFFPVVETITDRLEELDSSFDRKSPEGVIEVLGDARSDLMRLRRILMATGEAVGWLAKSETSPMGEQARVYLRDCQDHALRLLDEVESTRELNAGLQDLYVSAISMRMNEVMQTLTIFATIFMPMTFIAGIYGMNFDPSRSPWNMPELGWVYGYPMALGLMAATAVALLVYFRRIGWLGRPRRKRE